MTRASEPAARAQAARLLEALASNGLTRAGLAWLVHVRADAIVRGDPSLAVERGDLVSASLDADVTRSTPVSVGSRAMRMRVRPVAHGWQLATLWDEELDDAGALARMEQAASVLRRMIVAPPR